MCATILFLCSGNYYRSRFAEILFNHLAEQAGLEWVARSRGIVAAFSRNPGPISSATLEGLQARSISNAPVRYPRQLTESDLANARRVIALNAREHRPLLNQYFPDWTDRVEYWHVPDITELDAETALALIERNIQLLIASLTTIKRKGNRVRSLING
jgi:low molecular weight protein-tyrosine phosphatase